MFHGFSTPREGHTPSHPLQTKSGGEGRKVFVCLEMETRLKSKGGKGHYYNMSGDKHEILHGLKILLVNKISP